MMRFFLYIFFSGSCLFFADEASALFQERYKLYCMYTPEFQRLYEQYFLPSLKDDFEIIVREYPQECASGRFQSDGWDKTMLHKLELLLEAIEENKGQIFFYSDVDIIFLKPILEVSLSCLGNNDFAVQQGWPKRALCAGFFVMRANENTRKLIQLAYQLLKEKKYPDDQLAIQAALREFKSGEIDWTFLPSEQFPNGRRVLRKSTGLYSKDSEIKLCDAMVLFHANCCIGLDDKCHFLMRVEKECFLRGFIDGN